MHLCQLPKPERDRACACTDAAFSFPESCKEANGVTDCTLPGYVPGTYERPSTTCPYSCLFKRAGFPGQPSAQCSACIAAAVNTADGVDEVELRLVGECFPRDAVWGTRCSQDDSNRIRDNNEATHPSAACWMCITKAALDGGNDDLAPCMSRLTQGNAERARVTESAGQVMNRDSYCRDRVHSDAVTLSLNHADRCKDSACCVWDYASSTCGVSQSVSAQTCPLPLSNDLNLNEKASAAAVTVARGLALVATVFAAVWM